MCACCGSEPNGHLPATATRVTGVRTERVTHQSWDVPHCNRCLQHIETFEKTSAWIPVGIVAAIAVALGVVRFVSHQPSHNKSPDEVESLAIATALAAAVIVISISVVMHTIHRRGSRAQATSEMGSTCVAPFRSVTYPEWHGTMHTFVFERRPYLDAFLALNATKTRSIAVDSDTGEVIDVAPSSLGRSPSQRVRRSTQ